MLDQDPATFHRSIAARFTAVVDNTSGADWEAPSPVEGWTARDVVRHLIDWSTAFLGDNAGMTLPSATSVDDDPGAAWHAHTTGIQALLENPTAAAQSLSNPHLGEMPLGQALSSIYTGDVFLHTWDLARATGQDETLDPTLCAAMLEGLRPMDEMLRASGHYGPKVTVSDGADTQTRLLAFIGRDPRPAVRYEEWTSTSVAAQCDV